MTDALIQVYFNILLLIIYLIAIDTRNPFPNDKFQTPNLKKLADNSFIYDTNGRKFSKAVENIAGKGEIARYECFQKTCTEDT